MRLEKQLKVNKQGLAINKGCVKCKHIIFCLRRGGNSQFIPFSYREKRGC